MLLQLFTMFLHYGRSVSSHTYSVTTITFSFRLLLERKNKKKSISIVALLCISHLLASVFTEFGIVLGLVAMIGLKCLYAISIIKFYMHDTIMISKSTLLPSNVGYRWFYSGKMLSKYPILLHFWQMRVTASW